MTSREFFLAYHEEWNKKHKGKYVLIYEARLIGFFNNSGEAIQYMRANDLPVAYGNSDQRLDYHIQQIDIDAPVHRIFRVRVT